MSSKVSIERAITLRPEQAEDAPFRFALYASTRQEELDAWGWPPEVRSSFLELQFQAQATCYQTQFPKADFRIVLLEGKPIGRLIVDRAVSELRLVDIALLPEYRNAGVGGWLIRSLIAEAAEAGKPLRLNVLKGNRAARLYHRLGFVRTGESELYEEMEWRQDRRKKS